VRPATEGAVAGLLARARRDGLRLRVLGAGHSHSPLAATSGILLDLEAFSGLIRADPGRQRAVLFGGTRIFSIGPALFEHGLALVNQGDIDRQTLAGAVATGTHGTGLGLPSLSAAVVGARVVLADGRALDCDGDREPELFQALRLHLGAVGVVTRLTLAVRRAYRLRERLWLEPVRDLFERLPEHVAAHRHFELFWWPGRSRAVLKALDETEEAPRYPLGREGERLGLSYEVLPNHRPELHTEMEYAVPLERGPACFEAVWRRVTERHQSVSWPIQYRTVAGDDVWLSPAHGGPVATISLHQGISADEAPYFRDVEAILVEHGGRPHWGKVHHLGGGELAERLPRYRDWWRIRDRHDPEGLFLNEHLEALRPPGGADRER